MWFNKVVGGLPGALGPAEFAFHFPLIPSLVRAKGKWPFLRVRGAYVVKCADIRRNGLPKYLLNHFGNPLCIWLNFSVVSKARHECSCSKLFITSGLHDLKEQSALLHSYRVLGYYILTWVTLTQHFWNKQIPELTVSSLFSYLPETYTITSLHWGTTVFIFISSVWDKEVSFFLFFNWEIGIQGNCTTLQRGKGVHFPVYTFSHRPVIFLILFAPRRF